jgi:hypothetical protein
VCGYQKDTYEKFLFKKCPTMDRWYDLKNIFAEKIATKIDVFAHSTAIFVKKIIVTLVFYFKNAFFSAENWRKSRKTVFITLTPNADVIM